MAKKRKKSIILKLLSSYSLVDLVCAMGIALFLLISGIALVVLVYQNFERNIKESQHPLRETLEYLFPSEPPRPGRGRGASLSASFQNIYGWDEKYANLVSFAVIYQSHRHRIDPHLIKSIIKQESWGDPFVVSIKNCKGLMQPHPVNYDHKDVYHPWVNIREGTRVLAPLIDKYGIYGGLLAYNGSSPKNPYFESVVFARKVLDGI